MTTTHGRLVGRRWLAICIGWMTFCVAGFASPENLTSEPLCTVRGQVADMTQQTQTMGYSFSIGFGGIHYEGNVSRAVVEPSEAGRFNVRLALRDVRLTIDQISISGGRRGAQCGPLQLVLGSERELWFVFQVQRRTQEGRTLLEVVETHFELPADNWRIGQPRWVRTWGLGMTQGRVVSGLREGLANHRAAIERQLIGESGALFEQVRGYVQAELL